MKEFLHGRATQVADLLLQNLEEQVHVLITDGKLFISEFVCSCVLIKCVFVMKWSSPMPLSSSAWTQSRKMRKPCSSFASTSTSVDPSLLSWLSRSKQAELVISVFFLLMFSFSLLICLCSYRTKSICLNFSVCFSTSPTPRPSGLCLVVLAA